MWVVAKIKKNSNLIFKQDLLKKISNIEFYEPAYKANFINKNKKKTIKKNLFDSYIFCNFKIYSKNILDNTKFCKGLKYYLNGIEFYQKNIIDFIYICKKYEDSQNFITNKFFKRLITNKGKFFSGPLKNIVFDLIEKKKNKSVISFGNIVATIRDDKVLYAPE